MKPLLRSFLLGNLTLAAASSLHAATIINFSFEANVNPDVTDPAGQFAFGESRDFGGCPILNALSGSSLNAQRTKQ